MNLTRDDLIGEINALKSLLCDTDYKTLKFAEGELSVDEYEETKENRKMWRRRINEIEVELESEIQ